MNRMMTLGAAILMAMSGTAMAHDGVGLGIVTGDTNGVTVKVPTTATSGVDISAGVGVGENDGRVRADWNQNFVTLRSTNLVVPFYVGVGGFAELEDAEMGVRVPVGVAFELQNTPVEIYIQTGLEAEIVDADGGPAEIGASGALGLRLYSF